MRIEVTIENPENMEMTLELNDKKETIYDSTTIIFEVEEVGDYELIFQQNSRPNVSV